VIARFAAFAATVAALVAPATASAQVTRAIQSVSSPSSDHRWAPNAVSAQIGDTIKWRMTEPGNEANFVTHNVYIIKPGDSYPGVRLGSSIEGDGTATQLVDQPGTYAFYCSIHSTNGIHERHHHRRRRRSGSVRRPGHSVDAARRRPDRRDWARGVLQSDAPAHQLRVRRQHAANAQRGQVQPHPEGRAGAGEGL